MGKVYVFENLIESSFNGRGEAVSLQNKMIPSEPFEATNAPCEAAYRTRQDVAAYAIHSAAMHLSK